VVKVVWILALVGVVGSYFKMRQVWQWWSQRRALRLKAEAETIRDRLLQESFTMRRQLETALRESPDAEVQACLEQFYQFHQALNALSDRLSPPYLEDDLCLAIDHLLNSWKSQSELTIHYEPAPTWTQSADQRDPVILDALDELLRIITAHLLTPKVIFVSLSNDTQQLNLEVRIPNAEDLDVRSDLKHLAQVMRFLVGGNCSVHYHQQTLTWRYRQQRSGAFANPICKD
jgi:hypothetical protein